MQNNLPPAQMLMHPGPGVDGPGPGISMVRPPGVPTPGQTSQMYFVGPEGMQVNWSVGMPGQFDSEPLLCPGRHNFPQGAIYRLKLTNIPGRPGVELYPTLEVGPTVPRTAAFLSHNAIPVQFAEEDLDQVLTGNFVTKVIYLPDPEYQELALAGVETLVSTRLDPGVDPIVEADRRGAILGIVRLGNIDPELPSDGAGQDGIRPVAYMQTMASGMGPRPLGAAVGGQTSIPTNYISGVNAPQWGMPMSATPIGLPGPPHVPLGIPAGLQKHVIKNRTRVNIPEPTRSMRINVKQSPGISYPKPVNRVSIIERTFGGFGLFKQPFSDRREVIKPDCDAGYACPSDMYQQ
ncbi:MAG: hypothetical protein HQ567_06435 [Candidatus Nealsonbacteria bacterium]|nr:hypothetical protein [Candidatus Nealsonbacteria bacterium]